VTVGGSGEDFREQPIAKKSSKIPHAPTILIERDRRARRPSHSSSGSLVVMAGSPGASTAIAAPT
jgi:hypothetical protein